MGASESSKKKEIIDPGPLGDEEVRHTIEAFREYSKDGTLDFAAMLDIPNDYGANLHQVAKRNEKEVSIQGLVDFIGETTRGGRSKRLTHVLCAAVGLATLVDPKTGEPYCVDEAKLGRIFQFAWQILLTKHHVTEEGFDDDSDNITASTRDVLYGGSANNGAAVSKRKLDALDPGPFVASIVEAARLEAAREREAARLAEVPATGHVLEDDKVDLSFVARWADRHAPEIADAWTAYVRATVFRDYGCRYEAPRLWDVSDILGHKATPARGQMMAALSLASATCRGDWKRLYASGVDGFSLYRLCHQILGWHGATAILLKSIHGEIFGAVLHEPWREWHTYYGGTGTDDGDKSFLFALRPTLRICRFRRGPGARTDAQFLNTTSSKFKGLALGSADGTPDCARLAIPEALNDAVVHVRRSDLTFEPGDLAPLSGIADNAIVSIDALEVWGLANDADAIHKADAGRKDARQTRAEHVRRAGKVDKAKFLENSFDREHLLGKTFAGTAKESEFHRTRDQDL